MTIEQHDNLGQIVTNLMKGILYKDDKPDLWSSMERLEGAVRDYLKVIGLELEIYESDGFAFLKNRDDGEGDIQVARLVSRRPLSYSVSLILALLRRKLTEHDAFSGDPRLILHVDEVRDMVSAFFPGGSNEVKVLRRLDAHLQRIRELGFIRFLDNKKEKLEVRRILKAYIDAQWLSELDNKLEEYLSHGEADDE